MTALDDLARRVAAAVDRAAQSTRSAVSPAPMTGDTEMSTAKDDALEVQRLVGESADRMSAAEVQEVHRAAQRGGVAAAREAITTITDAARPGGPPGGGMRIPTSSPRRKSG